MSLTSLLESITRRQQQRRLTKWSDYRHLVAAICDGKEPDANEIARVLADNERTIDELRHDAQLLARRRKLRAEMDAILPREGEAKKVQRRRCMFDETRSFRSASKPIEPASNSAKRAKTGNCSPSTNRCRKS